MTDELHLFRTMRPAVSGPSTAARSEERRLLLAAITPAPRLRLLTLRPLGAILSSAAVFAAAIFIVTGSGSGGDTAWAASVVKIAQSAPRLLVVSDGWKVTRADQFGGDAGEMTFASSSQQVELRWEPAGNYPSTVADFNSSADRVATASVLGATAQIYHYRDTDLYTAVWAADSHVLQLEGASLDAVMIESVLAQLQFVSVNAWLSALPSSVVLSGARNDVVRSMLADIPLPRGVERSQFTDGDAVRDRYQLGAQIVSSVSCGWITRWISAKRTGNALQVAEAVKAMTAVADSRVLRQMDSSGAYPTVVREFAGAMAHGGNVVGPYAIGDQSVEDSYRSSLGCAQ